MQSVNKKASIVAAVALITWGSHAAIANELTLPLNTVSSSDLSYAFDQSAGPVQVLALSDQEMKETEGEWLPIWFGFVGGGVNAINSYMNGGSSGQVAYSFGTGFSGGFFAGIPGGSAALQVGRAAVGGAMTLSPYPF